MSDKTTNEAIFCGNQLLTYREASKFLAISQRSLWQLACDGLIPQVRIGRSVRFDFSDLNAFVTQQKERSGVKLAPLVLADVACAENVVSGRGI